MRFHDIGSHRILQAQSLEVVGIVHPHVVGLVLHHRKGPALHFEEVVADLIKARRTEDIHLLSIQLPWFLVRQPTSGDPKPWFYHHGPLESCQFGVYSGGHFWTKPFLNPLIPVPGCSPSLCVPSMSHPQRHIPHHSRVPRTRCTFLERC